MHFALAKNKNLQYKIWCLNILSLINEDIS